MNAELNVILRDLRRGMEELYGDRLERLVLFGSRARGDADPDSDIDVLVVLRGEVDPDEEILRGGEVTARVSLMYDAHVSSTYVSSERYAIDRGPLFLNIREEGKAV